MLPRFCIGQFLVAVLVAAALQGASGQCTNAAIIGSIPFKATGNTTNSASIGTSCSSVASSSPAEWFSLEGTGQYLYASTCNADTKFDTQIVLYNITSGSSCSAAACLATATKYINQSCAVIGFQADVGNTIYFAITGNKASNFGNFSFEILNAQPAEYAPGREILPTQAVVSILGDNTASGFDFVPSTSDLPAGSKGFWYSFVGDGNSMNLTTCNPGTNFDTAMVLFEQPCNHLYCVKFKAFSDNDAALMCSTIDIVSDADRIYHVFITGATVADLGTFNLTISRLVPASPALEPQAAPVAAPVAPIGTGFFCEQAVPLELNVRSSPIVVSAYTEATAKDCVAYSSTASSKGKWFRFVAPSNGTFTIHTCEQTTNIFYSQKSTRILLYRTPSCSSCACLSATDCTESSDSSIGFCASHAFEANATDVFYAYVASAYSYIPTTSTETFSVIVQKGSLYQRAIVPQLGFSVCSTTVVDLQLTIPVTGDLSSSSTTSLQSLAVQNGAWASDVCGVQNTTRGLWYRINQPRGTGQILASTCFPETKADTIISVFKGPSCSFVDCVKSNDDALSCNSNSRASHVVAWDSSSSTFSSVDSVYLFISKSLNSDSTASTFKLEIRSDRAYSSSNDSDLIIGLTVGLTMSLFVIIFTAMLVCFCKRTRCFGLCGALSGGGVSLFGSQIVAQSASGVQVVSPEVRVLSSHELQPMSMQGYQPGPQYSPAQYPPQQQAYPQQQQQMGTNYGYM